MLTHLSLWCPSLISHRVCWWTETPISFMGSTNSPFELQETCQLTSGRYNNDARPFPKMCFLAARLLDNFSSQFLSSSFLCFSCFALYLSVWLLFAPTSWSCLLITDVCFATMWVQRQQHIIGFDQKGVEILCNFELVQFRNETNSSSTLFPSLFSFRIGRVRESVISFGCNNYSDVTKTICYRALQ